MAATGDDALRDEVGRLRHELDAARDAGASGGKICGAGGGGYLLIACTPDVRAAVRTALESMGGQFAPFDFDRDGVRAMRGDRVWTPTAT